MPIERKIEESPSMISPSVNLDRDEETPIVEMHDHEHSSRDDSNSKSHPIP